MIGNFSLPELLIVGALALIVIGPKDLPRMMRSLGKFVGQARGLARQFQRSMDDAAREIDLQEFKEAKALLDKPADTSAVTDVFTKSVDLDDDSDAKPKNPTVSRAKPMESAKTEVSSESPKPASPPPAPKPVASVPQTEAAEPAPAEAKQG